MSYAYVLFGEKGREVDGFLWIEYLIIKYGYNAGKE